MSELAFRAHGKSLPGNSKKLLSPERPWLTSPLFLPSYTGTACSSVFSGGVPPPFLSNRLFVGPDAFNFFYRSRFAVILLGVPVGGQPVSLAHDLS